MGYGLYCWVYHVKEASLTPRWWAQGCGSPGPSSWKKHHLTGPAKTRKTRGFDLSRSTNWFHFNSSRQTQKSCGLLCIALPESLDCIYAISPQPRFWSPLFHWRFDLLVVPRYFGSVMALREKHWPLKAGEIGLVGFWPGKSNCTWVQLGKKVRHWTYVR